MNDLMTKSFLSYVELKKQSQKEMEEESEDIEKGELNPTEEQNLSQFFQEVGEMKVAMEEITNLLFDLQRLNEDTKSTHSAKFLRGLRDQMESDSISVLKKATAIKTNLESLDRSNLANRKVSVAFAEGTCVDRTRISITSGLRVKLREMMNGFQALRDKILSDHKQDLRRRYYTATGEEPSDEILDKVILGGGEIPLFGGNAETDLRSRETHEAVMDIQRSLNKLHQVFLDMAVIVEKQGEDMDNIEANVANAGNVISGGTDNLYYANQMKKKKNKTWVYWVWAVFLVILVVCFISVLAS